MANYTSTSGSYTTTLTVTQTSQNTANNTSTLTYSLTLTKNAGSGLWNNNSCPWSITIDGTQVASGTFTYDFRNYSSLTLKSSTTTTVNHNSDGTKTVSVSASVNMNNSDYVSVMQPSGSLTLTTIPRASDVTVSNYSITNTTGSISATITSKANFYHKWRYKVGSGSWSAWTNKGQINNTSSTVTVANTTLLSGMPTSTSTTFYIEVQTYSDSGYATLVGTKSASSTISVNTSNIKPSISLGNIAINSSPISGYAVAGYSSVKSTATTTNSSGASSVTNYFTVSTGSLVSSSSTTASTTVTTNTVPANASNYTLTIYAYAKDSRGAVSSTVSKSITVYGYQPPTATLNAYRVASSSATTEDGAGTYAYVTFSGAVSSSVNSQNTIQSTTCTYSGSISGTATNGGHYALADTQTVTFTLTVTDKVTSSTTQKTISTASYPLDLYDNGSGTVGVGLGTIAAASKVSSSLPISISNKSYISASDIHTGDVTYEATTYNGVHSIAGKIYFSSGNTSTATKGISVMNNAGTYSQIIGVNQSNNATFYGTLSGNATSATRANNADYADNSQRLASYYFDSGDSACYIKLGTLTANYNNKTTEIIIYTGSGFNANGWQNGWARVQIKNAWQSTASATGAFGITYQVFGFQMSSFEVVGIATDYQTLQVWAYIPWGYGSGNYIVMGYVENWVHDGATKSTTVPSGTQQNITKIYSDESIVLWTGTLQGGASTLALPSIVNYCRRVKIYAYMAGELNMAWEVDTSKLDASTARHVNHSEPIYISNPGAWYMTVAEVTMTKTSITFVNAKNIRIDGTNHIVTQNGSDNYIIYRIDGLAY